MNYSEQKELFSDIIKLIWDDINELKISKLNNYKKIIKEIKTFKVIEINNLESFFRYKSYGNFILFKYKHDYYFCDTELIPILKIKSLIKIIDYKVFLRKEKILKILKINNK